MLYSAADRDNFFLSFYIYDKPHRETFTADRMSENIRCYTICFMSWKKVYC